MNYKLIQRSHPFLLSLFGFWLLAFVGPVLLLACITIYGEEFMMVSLSSLSPLTLLPSLRWIGSSSIQ